MINVFFLVLLKMFFVSDAVMVLGHGHHINWERVLVSNLVDSEWIHKKKKKPSEPCPVSQAKPVY